MEMPPALRSAINRALEGIQLRELGATAAALSQSYRGEQVKSSHHVASRQDALAYIATRLPATYAAARAAFAATAEARPDFAPRSALDIGAGPGTALWAAADCWADLTDAHLLEVNTLFLSLGQDMMDGANLPRVTWQRADVTSDNIGDTPHDLVTLAYVLNELPPEVRPRVIARLWRITAGLLVIVEPGTPAGWQRIIDARAQLIEAGGQVVAPCPHERACPLHPPDWCHFAKRVARSRQHRLAKDAEMPWEDEKFSYVAVSREPAAQASPRVIARPRKASGHVTLKLCRPDGLAENKVFSRRNGDAFKQARRVDWGETL